MTTYHNFDEQALDSLLQGLDDHYGARKSAGGELQLTEGCLTTLAECISVVVRQRKVCLDLPLGLGQHCIPIPISVPEGTAAKACLTLCTTWGIPTGVKVDVKVAGIGIVSQSFGKC